jgi:hypothetical protein
VLWSYKSEADSHSYRHNVDNLLDKYALPVSGFSFTGLRLLLLSIGERQPAAELGQDAKARLPTVNPAGEQAGPAAVTVQQHRA